MKSTKKSLKVRSEPKDLWLRISCLVPKTLCEKDSFESVRVGPAWTETNIQTKWREVSIWMGPGRIIGIFGPSGHSKWWIDIQKYGGRVHKKYTMILRLANSCWYSLYYINAMNNVWYSFHSKEKQAQYIKWLNSKWFLSTCQHKSTQINLFFLF